MSEENGDIFMAFENYSNVIELLDEVRPFYEKDNLIFVKSLQLFTTITANPKWPQNFDDLDNATSCICGATISEMVSYYEGKPDEINQLDSNNSFFNEFKAFCIAVKDTVSKYSVNKSDPLSISNISFSQDYISDTFLCKVIRQDNQCFDFNITKQEIAKLQEKLEEIMR